MLNHNDNASKQHMLMFFIFHSNTIILLIKAKPDLSTMSIACQVLKYFH